MQESQSKDIIPPVSEWNVFGNQWVADALILNQIDSTMNPLIESPQFHLTPGNFHIINIEYSIIQNSHTILQIVDLKKNRVIKERHQEGCGLIVSSLGFQAKKNTNFKIRLFSRPRDGKFAQFHNFKIDLLSYKTLGFKVSAYDTYLKHWGFLHRSIHTLCKKSRHINNIVSYIEMQLGRTVILSLPSFVAFCPTGQCNANCLFCSVAENRSGIVKTGMPKKIIENFIYQIGGSVWMFGIEGNGEPLMYKHINELLATIISKGSKLYLITNGSLLNNKLNHLLSSDCIDSINFSINGATDETHTKIMGLRNLDRINYNIKKIAHYRGKSKTPFLSISMVVNSINIHEVTDFIEMADSLRIDRVHIRPLSEIATSEGTVEDLRAIVPFENDIQNLRENIIDYLNDTAPRVEVIFDFASFKAQKTNPLNGIIPIAGFEDQILAPNRRYWHYDKGLIHAIWYLNVVMLQWVSKKEAVFLSESIPVQQHTNLRLELRLVVEKGEITISINGKDGSCLKKKGYPSIDQMPVYKDDISVHTQAHDRIRISIHGTAGSKTKIGFKKLRAYPKWVNRFELLHNFNKWEKNSDGLRYSYLNDSFQIGWNGRKFVYLLKSYSIPCYRNEHIEIKSEFDITHGELGVGILSGDGLKWISTFQFPFGFHKAHLRFNSGENETIQVVLYSNTDEKLSAEVKWKDFTNTMDSARGKTPGDQNVASGLLKKDSDRDHGQRSVEHIVDDSRDAAPENKSGYSRNSCDLALRFRLKRYLKERTRRYCQKPWTDLNNFSVDGRMDVCCITTGESQRKYALGNLFENEFQRIWNGPTAQKFRRTVNDENKRLPPCSRCPMAYQKQGLFFDFRYTKDYVKNMIRSVLFNEVPFLISLSIHFPKALAKKFLKHRFSHTVKR